MDVHDQAKTQALHTTSANDFAGLEHSGAGGKRKCLRPCEGFQTAIVAVWQMERGWVVEEWDFDFFLKKSPEFFRGFFTFRIF